MSRAKELKQKIVENKNTKSKLSKFFERLDRAILNSKIKIFENAPPKKEAYKDAKTLSKAFRIAVAENYNSWKGDGVYFLVSKEGFEKASKTISKDLKSIINKYNFDEIEVGKDLIRFTRGTKDLYFKLSFHKTDKDLLSDKDNDDASKPNATESNKNKIVEFLSDEKWYFDAFIKATKFKIDPYSKFTGPNKGILVVDSTTYNKLKQKSVIGTYGDFKILKSTLKNKELTIEVEYGDYDPDTFTVTQQR